MIRWGLFLFVAAMLALTEGFTLYSALLAVCFGGLVAVVEELI